MLSTVLISGTCITRVLLVLLFIFSALVLEKRFVKHLSEIAAIFDKSQQFSPSCSYILNSYV